MIKYSRIPFDAYWDIIYRNCRGVVFLGFVPPVLFLALGLLAG
jgi:hypothetical protein